MLKHALTAPLDGWVTEDVDIIDLQERGRELFVLMCNTHEHNWLPSTLLVCTDALVSYTRAIRETFRDPVQTG